jgi:hypothetical protein
MIRGAFTPFKSASVQYLGLLWDLPNDNMADQHPVDAKHH